MQQLLAESYLAATAPSFHLIPRGDAMLPEEEFLAAYERLAGGTDRFGRLTSDGLLKVLVDAPAALAPLRMIAGLTYSELAVAIRIATGTAVTGAALRSLEREEKPPSRGSPRWEKRERTLRLAAEAVVAVVERRVLEVPAAARVSFHSKLDKRDTVEGWRSVAREAEHGVPYWALLYQRYVGGVWRQVQDVYSEVKGDAVLEMPLEALLRSERIPFWRSPRGATGARATADRYGINPGPDFVIPEESPAVIVESKLGEDGGTVRDKAARIQRLAALASQRGLVLCALVDGKGWEERPSAMADVVIATSGRTFSLATLRHLVEVPEVSTWRGRA